jgi:predicted phosphodiesterase
MTEKINRVAVISDVHANIQGLEAVLYDIAQFQPDEIWHTGDLVGYGARPNEVIDMLRAVKAKGILGNHDEEALKTWGNAAEFNDSARSAIMWTKDALNETSRAFLYDLRPMARFAIGNEHALLVHGSPRAPMWEYMSAHVAHDAFDALRDFNADFGLYGHTHQAAEIYKRPTTAELDINSMPLAELQDRISMGWTYAPYIMNKLNPKMLEVEAAGAWMNAGSTGQPRDNDKRAAWLSLAVDKHGKTIRQIHRVEYDIQGAQQDILQAGLPLDLAERLEVGS